jgi:hypothetical protein
VNTVTDLMPNHRDPPAVLEGGPREGSRRKRGVIVAQERTISRTIMAEAGARGVAAPEIVIRLVGALLAVAVAGVHVADQGGVTALAMPDWIGWGYRAIEVGGVLTALALLLSRPGWLRPAWLGWAAAVLLGAGPFIAYIASRTVGIPGDHGDVGNWGYWVGTVSLFVEAALLVLSISMVLTLLRHSSRAAASRA